MKPSKIKQKLALLETSGVRQLLMDVLELSDKMNADYPAVIKELEATYKKLLPGDQVVVQKDLETEIQEYKNEQK